MKTKSLGSRRWAPALPRFSSSEIFPNRRLQMGLAPALVPVVLTAARFLVPIAIGAGTFYAITQRDETGELTTLGIENWKLSYSALAAGIGTAALLGGGLLPENLRPAANIIGALGLAGSAAVLFWPTKKAAERPRVQDGLVEDPLPANTASAVLARDIVITMPPDQPNASGTVRSALSAQEYEYRVTNYSGEDRSFFVGALITNADDGSTEYKTPIDSNDILYGRQAITVPGDDKPHAYTIKVPNIDPIGFTDILVGQLVDVSIEAFRTLNDRLPALESNVISIRYSPHIGTDLR